MKAKPALRFMFILGAVIDGLIAISWFLIASGLNIPNILNGHIGTGPDYQLAMYIGAMFMSAWSLLLVWGALNPVERRGILPITSVFLVLSVVIELMFFRNMLGGAVFVFGVTKRIIISVLFVLAYIYSLKAQDG